MTGAAPRAVLVTTSVGDLTVAERIARTVVEEGLAACVHISSPVTSTYRWQGRTEVAREWVLQCKTGEGRQAALMARLKALHPYEVPEILATPVVAGDPQYLAWVAEATGGSPPSS